MSGLLSVVLLLSLLDRGAGGTRCLHGLALQLGRGHHQGESDALALTVADLLVVVLHVAQRSYLALDTLALLKDPMLVPHLHLILAGVDERGRRGGVRSGHSADDSIGRSQRGVRAAQPLHARHGHEGHVVTRRVGGSRGQGLETGCQRSSGPAHRASWTATATQGGRHRGDCQGGHRGRTSSDAQVQRTGRGSRHRRSTDGDYGLGQSAVHRRGGVVVPAHLHPRAAAPGAVVVAVEALASSAGSLRGRGRGRARGVVLVMGGP